MDARFVQLEHTMTPRIVLPVISVQLEQQLKTMGLSTSGSVVGTSYPEGDDVNFKCADSEK